MTGHASYRWHGSIIPYQQLLGNYDSMGRMDYSPHIIPYQELLGNYDGMLSVQVLHKIIPYQELLGNYDLDHNLDGNKSY